MPKIPATIRIWTRFAPVTIRERKIRSGTSGFAASRWRTTNATSSPSATAPKPIVCSDPQPYPLASTIV